MPAVSKSQRRLMVIAEHHPEQVSEKNRGVLNMKKEELQKFSKTKEKGLPERKKSKGKNRKKASRGMSRGMRY